MVRNILGSLLALLGAAAVVRSPFLDWYGGRPGRDYSVEELFRGSGITAEKPPLFSGLLLPMLVVAVLVVIAVLLRSRLLTTLAGLVGLGFTVLWMVRQGQAAGNLTVGSGGELGEGVAAAAGGSVLVFLGALVMRGRRPPPRGRRRRGDDRPREDEGYAPYGPDDRYEPAPYHPQQPYPPYQAQRPYEQPPYGRGPAYGEEYETSEQPAPYRPAPHWDAQEGPGGGSHQGWSAQDETRPMRQQPPSGPQDTPEQGEQGVSDTQPLPRTEPPPPEDDGRQP
ncbi:hypothetical protein [Streptomyces sp. HNM0574]|uniref:hypothetical protein n=1 Tax=Streptomyces sp. HNM0574 TaxID=2714954 RepID=UPI0019D0E041